MELKKVYKQGGDEKASRTLPSGGSRNFERGVLFTRDFENSLLFIDYVIIKGVTADTYIRT